MINSDYTTDLSPSSRAAGRRDPGATGALAAPGLLLRQAAARNDGSQAVTIDEEVDRIVRSGARGAIVLAGVSTAIVIGLWFAFYFLVFSPRSGA